MSPITLKFTVDLEDIVMFSVDHQRNSKRFQRSLWIQRFAYLAVFLGLGLLMMNSVLRSWSETDSSTGSSLIAGGFFCLICLIPGIVIFAFLPGRRYRAVRSAVKKAYSDGKNATIFGAQTLRIEDGTLTMGNDYYETRFTWAVFEKVLISPKHIYLYTSSVSAIVIPKDKIVEGSLGDTEEMLKVIVNLQAPKQEAS